ncbi:MAG: prepilin-type N-terminal cleavage/methylation domain-containing protein [Clostridia bacterium]
MNKNKGMSLVELVTAVAILSVSILMITSCFYGVASIRGKILQYSNMQMISENIFEQMRVSGDWSSDEFEESEDVFEYNGLTFEVEQDSNGLCTITFSPDDADNSKAYYFWIDPIREDVPDED